MQRDSMVFYRSFHEATRELPPEIYKEAMVALMDYALDGRINEVSAYANMFLQMAKPQVDANNQRYINGSKGGRKPEPKSEKGEVQKTKPEPKRNQTGTKSEPNVNVNVNDNVLKDKTYTCAFEALWKAYPRKKEKAGAYRCYKARLADGFSEDELETAVKRYADECQRQKTEQKYIKLAATFLGPSTPFMDYLGEAEENDTGGETAAGETGYVKRLVEQGFGEEFEGF